MTCKERLARANAAGKARLEAGYARLAALIEADCAKYPEYADIFRSVIPDNRKAETR